MFAMVKEKMSRLKRHLAYLKWASNDHNRDFLLQRLPKHSVGAEVGVNYGDFSRRMLEVLQPKTVYLIDCWDRKSEVRYDFVRKRFDHEITEGRVVIIKDFSVPAAKRIPDNSLDWAYIDADHSYAAVKKDLEAYYPKLKNLGFFCGDDYTSGYYSKTCEKGDKASVKRAVDWFVKKYPVRVIEIREFQFLLQKVEDKKRGS